VLTQGSDAEWVDHAFHYGPVEIVLDLNTRKSVSGYRLMTSGEDPSEDPAGWVLLGSSDNRSWYHMDERFDARALPLARGAWSERFELPVPKESSYTGGPDDRPQFLYTLPPAEASRRAKIDIATLAGKEEKLHSRAAEMVRAALPMAEKPPESPRPSWRPAAQSKFVPPPDLTKKTPRTPRVHVPFKLPLNKTVPLRATSGRRYNSLA
jgi:hypothetical protein